MQLSIPRGIVYHLVLQDIVYLIRAFFSPLTNQAKILKFEKKFAEYMGVKHCLAFPFARTAIYYSLKAKDLPKGSQIIMPPITIKQILDVVIACGLEPVFVDINPETLCFDSDKLKAALGPKTKAILLTYLFGMVPDLGELISLCKERDLFVLEDFSQCLNGKFADRKVGSFGDVGIYSSSSIKTLDTYGGGLLVCHNDLLYERLKEFKESLPRPSRTALILKIWTDLCRNVATNRIVFHVVTFPFLRLAVKLNPERVIKHVGHRSTQMLASLPEAWFEQYTSLQAELGLTLLPQVEEGDSVRAKNVQTIKSWSTDTGFRFPKGALKSENVYWQFVAYCENPLVMQKYLQSKRIDSSTTSLVYISNLPSYPYQGLTPNAETLHSNGMFIPAYPGLSQVEIRHIATVLNQSKTELQL